jgi:C4-dicarboxylate-specific signal transduction histidine kinase
MEAFISSLRFSRRPQIVAFNWASAAVSILITSSVLRMGLRQCCYAPNEANYGHGLCGGDLHDGSDSLRFQLRHRGHRRRTKSQSADLANVAKALSLDFDNLFRRAHVRRESSPAWSTFIGVYAFVITLPIIAIIFPDLSHLPEKRRDVSSAGSARLRTHVKELSHYIAEQERIREQFSQMEKLSALGELASGVAHDFNNTLAGILGRAQLTATHQRS